VDARHARLDMEVLMQALKADCASR
jgi:hypothetical protein